MKFVWTLFSVVLIGVFSGCSVTEESVEGVGTQFQEGIQGRGHIVPNDPTSDSFGPVYQ